MPMTHDEKLALGKVCGCGDCEYCEEVWIETRYQQIVEVFRKIEPEKWTEKQRGYMWQKSK